MFRECTCYGEQNIRA